MATVAREFLVDDRCLLTSDAGLGVYIRNLLGAWPAAAEYRPRTFCDRLGLGRARSRRGPGTLRLRPLAAVLSEAAPAGGGKGRIKIALLRAYEALYAWEYRRGRYAANFEPNFHAVPTRGPIVATCHDLSPLEHAQWHPADRVRRWHADLDRSLRATDRWIAVSEFTKGRMVALLGIPPERITTIPHAARCMAPPPATSADEFLAAAGLGGPYILHVGTIEPRKNLSTLLDAYGMLPPRVRAALPLVLAGGFGWGTCEFRAGLAAHPMAAEVRATGRIADCHLGALVRAASALVAPSSYEGFGLPIIEAMAMATPVVCSTAAAFREVGGDAAAYVPPDDPAAWRDAIARAAEDATWREHGARAGLEQAARFSWERTARAHADVLRAAAESL